MVLDLVVRLFGSQAVRMLATEVAVALACQAAQYAAGSVAQKAVGRRKVPTSTPVSVVPEPTQRTTLSRDVRAKQPPTPADATLHAVPAVDVVSDIPGRVRVRVHGILNNAARARDVEAMLRMLDGVRTVDANPRTGTVLVQGDPDKLSSAPLVSAFGPVPASRVCRPADCPPHLHLVVG